jgi:hypothetical protein
LKVSQQGALNLVGELGLREMTGRGGFGRGEFFNETLAATGLLSIRTDRVG